MTDREWWTSFAPWPMMEAVRGVSGRKHRLFACACCRRIWHLLPDLRSRDAVEVAERAADGAAVRNELLEAYVAASAAAHDVQGPWYRSNVAGYHAAQAAAWALCCGTQAVWQVSTEATKAVRAATGVRGGDVVSPVRAEQAGLLRDIFGPLAFRKVAIQPSLLRWNDSTVVKLAQAIYEYRQFGDLPVLADALEEAGCDNEDVLTHCREPGLHVPVCWVIDMLLGKT
jgi:hypothetical protein